MKGGLNRVILEYNHMVTKNVYNHQKHSIIQSDIQIPIQSHPSSGIPRWTSIPTPSLDEPFNANLKYIVTAQDTISTQLEPFDSHPTPQRHFSVMIHLSYPH